MVGGDHVGSQRGDGEVAAGGDDVGGEVDQVGSAPADVGGRRGDELLGEVWDAVGAPGGLEDLEHAGSRVYGVGSVRDDGGTGDACEEESEVGRHFVMFLGERLWEETCRKSDAVCVCVCVY